jgi:hemoglobin
MTMRATLRTTTIAAAAMLALAAGPAAAAEDGPSVGEQMAALEQMCTDTADARTRRHADTPLYERLGGYERIHALTREIVRRHNANPDIRHMFVHVDPEQLASHVADFMAAGTGGTATYTGRAMPAAHARLELTNADFLAAGGDIVSAMQGLGFGQDEIDEVVCILVSLKDQVVFK